MDSNTQITRVSKWISQLGYWDIPDDIRSLAKLQLLDCFSAIMAGSFSTVGVRLKKALLKAEAGGSCTLLPEGEKWSLGNSVYYHAAMINSLELDHFMYMGHLSESIIPVVLSIGEIHNLTGKELLLAQVTATEVSGRMGAHMFSGPLQGHMRSFLHRAGAATAVAKLLSYDVKTIARALSISLSMPELPLYPACFSPDTKVICTSAPSVEGINSAFMAECGMDGPLDIIENPAGFLAFFSYVNKYPDIWRWIGDSWLSYTLNSKKYATCGYAQGPVTAAVKLRESENFSSDEIEKINIYAPMLTLVMEKFSKPHYGATLTPVNTHFSTIRSVAAALIYGELTGKFYAESSFEEKAGMITKLSDKCNLLHEWQMTVNLIRNIDAGLVNAGKYGFLCLRSSERTLSRFRKAFGSRPMLGLRDLGEAINIPISDQLFFLGRYLRSFSGNYSSGELYHDAENSYSHEGDLSKMTFPMSGRVEVILKNKRRYESTCIIPPGYNPAERESTIKNKFMRECVVFWGESKASQVMQTILNLENHTCRDLMNLISKN